ncbi:hypothetical protein PACTADRAFT_483 [Pachysolen tannophilus NRRL Y-2460]|uniref:DNA damage checkpoint protein LCD1 n=1 Tax=Pachysolen tannophilus NRRL Y-2460 TaxID=669874 RepID=A0A1E4U1W5_PACTA|nr:hypothetical protein PACTADRAFT_483 [Pachysolen tannophilus NRRL Y-2460]
MSSGSDSFDDDDDDVFIALTARHSEKQTQNHSQFQQQSDESGLVLPPPMTIEDDSQLLAVQGENSILRAKLEELERAKNADLKKARDRYNAEINEKNSRIQAYKDAIIRIEDEKKFLSSEIKSLSTKSNLKKRKLNTQGAVSIDTQRPSVHNDVISTASEFSPKRDVIMIDNERKGVGIGAETNANANTEEEEIKKTQAQTRFTQEAPKNITILKQTTIIPNEKELFIETICNHVINGAPRSTLDYLFKISSEIDFEHEGFIVIAGKDNIKSLIIDYLIQYNKSNLRLDNLLSEFIEVLTVYIQRLLLASSFLPVPFLLALVHCALIYRPVAISGDIIEQLLTFNADLMSSYISTLKPISDNAIDGSDSNSISTLHQKSYQLIVLERFIATFSLDIVEVLSQLSQFNGVSSIKKFSTNFPRTMLIAGLALTTPINYVFNMIEILINSTSECTFAYTHLPERENGGDGNDGDSTVTYISEDDNTLLLTMTKLLMDGLPLKEGFRIYGLNRIIGNNDDIELLDALVPNDDVSDLPLSNLITQKPLPISSDKFSFSKNTAQNKISHELHALDLRLQILRQLELLVLYDNFHLLKSETLLSIIKIIIYLLAGQQEYIMRVPRCETIQNRILIINSVVKIIHYIWTNSELSQRLLTRLSNDVSYELLLSFARISFSTTDNLSSSASAALTQIRESGFKHAVYNKNLEFKNYELSNLKENYIMYLNKKFNNNSEKDDEMIIQELIKTNMLPNGLEFPYDDDVIEMARDVLEIYTTADEADNLYFSMNYVPETNDIDELMLEYADGRNGRH